MKSDFTRWMKVASRRQILWIAIIVSEIASGIIVSLMSVLIQGSVTADYLITSLVTAFAAAFLVVSIILLFLEQLRQVEAQLVQNEAQLRSALAGREVLLKEIHHRVKNNMQVISSLLSLQGSSLADDHLKELLADSQNRINSMALVHEQLYQASDLSYVDFAEYVQRLTNHLMASYRVNVQQVKCMVSIEDIFLDIDTVIPCGLIINELVSNAFKHAFSADEAGMVTVEVQHANEGVITLAVRDSGGRLPAEIDFSNTTTLGLRLVHRLVGQLGGSVETQIGDETAFLITFQSPNGKR